MTQKHIDEHYKDWCGTHHTLNSGYPVHDSSETCDFAEYYHKAMQDYADLQKPKWIPIQEADKTSNQKAFVTFERKDNTRFTTEVSIKNIEGIAKHIGLKAIAYIPINIPEPYQK